MIVRHLAKQAAEPCNMRPRFPPWARLPGMCTRMDYSAWMPTRRVKHARTHARRVASFSDRLQTYRRIRTKLTLETRGVYMASTSRSHRKHTREHIAAASRVCRKHFAGTSRIDRWDIACTLAVYHRIACLVWPLAHFLKSDWSVARALRRLRSFSSVFLKSASLSRCESLCSIS